MREAERRCWTPAVGAPWARLDAALGAPRLSLLSEERGGGAAACFSSELYALADLGHEGAPDDLKVNSGVELLRAAAAGWVRRLAAAAAAAGALRLRLRPRWAPPPLRPLRRRRRSPSPSPSRYLQGGPSTSLPRRW